MEEEKSILVYLSVVQVFFISFGTLLCFCMLKVIAAVCSCLRAKLPTEDLIVLLFSSLFHSVALAIYYHIKNRRVLVLSITEKMLFVFIQMKKLLIVENRQYYCHS